MVDDNEVLDWGNDEEDISEPTVEPPAAQAAIFDDDDDDPEDNISLGDEDEEEQYSLRAPEAFGHTDEAIDISEDMRSPVSPPSQRTVDDARIALQTGSTRARDGGASKSSRMTEQSHRSSARSAPRTPGNSSRLARPIHALPAKPTSRPVGMPPHVEAYPGATPMVTETPRISRDAKRANGAASKASPVGPNDRPSKGPEEDRRSRDGDSSRYSDSYNHSPPDSDRRVQNLSVTSRPPHRRSPSLPNPPSSFHANSNDPLSFDDRHYRPSNDTYPAIGDVRSTEAPSSRYSRHDDPPRSPRRRPRPSSPPPRDRDDTYIPDRDSGHPPRGPSQSHRRNADVARVAETPVIVDRTWEPSAEYTKNEMARAPSNTSRRQEGDYSRQPVDDRSRPSARRSESYRDSRDREPLRFSEMQPPSNSGYYTETRHRSPSPPPPPRRTRDDEYRPNYRRPSRSRSPGPNERPRSPRGRHVRSDQRSDTPPGTAYGSSRLIDSEVRRQSPHDEAVRGRPSSSLDRLDLSPRPRLREDLDNIPSLRIARNEQKQESQSRSAQPVLPSEDATRAKREPLPPQNSTFRRSAYAPKGGRGAAPEPTLLGRDTSLKEPPPHMKAHGLPPKPSTTSNARQRGDTDRSRDVDIAPVDPDRQLPSAPRQSRTVIDKMDVEFTSRAPMSKQESRNKMEVDPPAPSRSLEVQTVTVVQDVSKASPDLSKGPGLPPIGPRHGAETNGRQRRGRGGEGRKPPVTSANNVPLGNRRGPPSANTAPASARPGPELDLPPAKTSHEKQRDGRMDDDHDWERSAQDSVKRAVSPPPRPARDEVVDPLRQRSREEGRLSRQPTPPSRASYVSSQASEQALSLDTLSRSEVSGTSSLPRAPRVERNRQTSRRADPTEVPQTPLTTSGPPRLDEGRTRAPIEDRALDRGIDRERERDADLSARSRGSGRTQRAGERDVGRGEKERPREVDNRMSVSGNGERERPPAPRGRERGQEREHARDRDRDRRDRQRERERPGASVNAVVGSGSKEVQHEDSSASRPSYDRSTSLLERIGSMPASSSATVSTSSSSLPPLPPHLPAKPLSVDDVRDHHIPMKRDRDEVDAPSGMDDHSPEGSDAKRRRRSGKRRGLNGR